MEPPENVTVGFASAEKIILRWDSMVSEEARERMIFDGERQEIDRYLQAVDDIQRLLASATMADDHNQANSAIQIAMARLEDEFRNILIAHTKDEDFAKDNAMTREAELQTGENSTSSSYRSTHSIRELDLIPCEVIDDLRSIAERMISAGYFRECVQVYGSVRKSAVDGTFRRLGIENLSIGDIQKLEREALERKIRRWTQAAKVCVRTVFASEKRLSEQIFKGLGAATDDACFMETVKGPAIQLFNFVEAVSNSRRSPEKLFKILDLHDALSDLLPDVEVVFQSKSSESIRVQAAEILSRLAEAARGILSEFENAVLREPSEIPGSRRDNSPLD
ncbi:hypothetical protein F0562_022765 [Nyssa sinensis]|uniref:Exocyst subunit Exo70 family protein n=1 Tax=Nyssa sinensis TaxID=561372 RepID=A0A5J5BEL4_9ASTE|nr:hypothetical protein F0562_022765 [Nyssa sinensis]